MCLSFIYLSTRIKESFVYVGLSGLCVGVLLSSQALAQTNPVSIELNQRVPSQSRSQGEDAYTLGAGDRIRLDVLQLPQYSGEFDVLVNGAINLPVVGEVYIEGMSLEQASNAITTTYSQILRRPVISLNLVSRRTIQIGISGEINRPGSYTITPEDTDFPTLTQILEEAGGIRLAADLTKVQIRRQVADSERILIVDLQQLLRAGDLRADITLRDGDSVFVPTATSPDIASVNELTTASFATDEDQEINIAVVGEVFRPGPYIVTGSAQTGVAGSPGSIDENGRLPTVTRAIQVAGGIKPLADVRRVQVRRPTHSGSHQTIEVNLWQLLQEGDLRQDLALQEGDTVFVPTATDVIPEDSAQLASASFSPATIQVNVVGEVNRPGVVAVPPNTPLNRAVLAAGGFNNRASRRTVELIRLNPNGTVAAREIPVDFAQGIDEGLNPALQNNDVVVVRRSTVANVADALDVVGSPVRGFLNLFTFPFQFIRLLD